METLNHFTCLSYDSVDFLIQSKYIYYGIYLYSPIEEKNIIFESELLPHICIEEFLEKKFQCKPVEECNVMLVLKKDDLKKSVQKKIEEFTGTKFPVSGNFALSVNSSVSSKIIELSELKLLPESIREKQNECSVNAIGFSVSEKEKHIQFLLAPDKLIELIIRGEP